MLATSRDKWLIGRPQQGQWTMKINMLSFTVSFFAVSMVSRDSYWIEDVVECLGKRGHKSNWAGVKWNHFLCIPPGKRTWCNSNRHVKNPGTLLYLFITVIMQLYRNLITFGKCHFPSRRRFQYFLIRVKPPNAAILEIDRSRRLDAEKTPCGVLPWFQRPPMRPGHCKDTGKESCCNKHEGWGWGPS